jgi:hypothetical protein
MNWSELVEKFQRVEDLPLTARAAYLLAQKNTPQDVVEGVIEGHIEPTEEAIKAARSEGGETSSKTRAERERTPAEQVLSLMWRLREIPVTVEDICEAYEATPDDQWPERIRLTKLWGCFSGTL